MKPNNIETVRFTDHAYGEKLPSVEIQEREVVGRLREMECEFWEEWDGRYDAYFSDYNESASIIVRVGSGFQKEALIITVFEVGDYQSRYVTGDRFERFDVREIM